MRCNNCGNENTENVDFCDKCGFRLSSQSAQPQQSQQQDYFTHPQQPQQQDYFTHPQQQQPQADFNAQQQQGDYNAQQPQNNSFYGQPYGYPQGYNGPPPQYIPPQNQGYYAGPQQNSKNAVPALVLGILSILCGGAMLFSILAIVFGAIGIREQKQRGLSVAMPMTGLILGIVGAVVGVIMLIYLLPAYLEEFAAFLPLN